MGRISINCLEMNEHLQIQKFITTLTSKLYEVLNRPDGSPIFPQSPPGLGLLVAAIPEKDANRIVFVFFHDQEELRARIRKMLENETLGQRIHTLNEEHSTGLDVAAIFYKIADIKFDDQIGFIIERLKENVIIASRNQWAVAEEANERGESLLPFNRPAPFQAYLIAPRQ
jgi:hypothetical protein